MTVRYEIAALCNFVVTNGRRGVDIISCNMPLKQILWHLAFDLNYFLPGNILGLVCSFWLAQYQVSRICYDLHYNNNGVV